MTSRLRPFGRGGWPALPIALMIALGCLRIVSTYGVFWQTWDEPFHIAAGMEWLDRGQYTYEPLHPPLARVVAALGPYLRGVRGLAGMGTPWIEGNALLHTGDAYEQNVAAARLGILLFFIQGSLAVALWARHTAGWLAALLATLLFTTLPPVLGHAGVATLDMACAASVATALFAFVLWLRRATPLRSAFLGISVGLAVLSKFSAVGFLTAAGGCTVALGWMDARRRRAAEAGAPGSRRRVAASAIVLLLLGLTIWAGYRFSIAPLVGAEDRPHGIIDRLVGADGRLHDASYAIVENTPVPAPEFVQGLSSVYGRDRRGHLAFLLGEISRSGWWYYYPLMLLLKTPLPFILLAAIGLIFLAREIVRTGIWFPAAVPPIAATSILLVGMLGSVDNGLRQLLSIYPFLAIMAGYGAAGLVSWGKRARWVGLGLATGLCCWQLVSSFVAHPDYLAYFNALAGSQPARIVVDGDLDWGQDLKRLSLTVERRGIRELSISYFGSLDIDLGRFGFGETRQLEPYRRETGWVAVSVHSLKLGTGRAPYDQFAWLADHEPVEQVGKSIWLYHIPEDQPVPDPRTANDRTREP